MLQSLFEWVGALPVSRAMNESGWLVATIQGFHLLAIAMLAGAILVVDLRLLRRGLTDEPVAGVARESRPWFLIGLGGAVLTGIPQLMSMAEKEYYSEFFWLKMYALAAALVFTMTVRRAVVDAPREVHRLLAGLVGLVSMVLWSSVAVSARLIGLF